MEITIGKKSGFCFGVKRAVELLENAIVEEKNVYTLGEIIHNNDVVDEFKQKGVKIISENEIDDLPQDSIVVVRSHGAKKKTFDNLADKGAKVVDATCVFVKKIQEIVHRHYNDGFNIVIIGKKNHPEVEGINGWCDEKAIIIEDESDVDNIKNLDKLCVVVQTTYSEKKYLEILNLIVENRANLVEVFNTICYTTKERQKESENLAKTSEAIIVIGGAHSSNAKELFNICKLHCDNVFFVQNKSELDFNIINKFKKIGVVAGASTPQRLIKEVVFNMEEKKEISMADVVEAMDKVVKLKKGQKIAVTVSNVKDEGVYVWLPSMKADKLMDKDEACENGVYDPSEFAVGDEITVKVISIEPLVLSRKALLSGEVEDKQILELAENKTEFTMIFKESNKGGLIGRKGTYSVFVPSSQIKAGGKIVDLEKQKGKVLRLVITECDTAKRKVVASQRVLLDKEKAIKDEERRVKEDSFWSAISEGQVVNGKVVRYAEFGVFVNIDGFDCLVHKSDVSWYPSDKMEDILLLNNTYDFKVLSVKREANKVSLGYKQLQSRPWDNIDAKYPAGSVVKGKVARLSNFGAFIELEKGVDGLVHVSQICHEWIDNAETKLKVGEEIEAKVLEVSAENERITLSIKALIPAPPRAERAKEENDAQRTDKNANRRPARANNANFDRRQPRRERRPEEDADVVKNWSDDSSSGASIGDLLKGLNLDFNEEN